MNRYLLLLTTAILCICPLYADAPLKLSAPRAGDRDRFQEPAPGTYEMRGGLSLLGETEGSVPTAEPVIEFEYFCAGGLQNFGIIAGPPFSAESRRMMPPLGHSEAWTPYAALLASDENPLPEGWKQLRLDIGLPADRVLQLRNIRLRAARPGEFEAAAGASAASSSAEAINAYLDTKFPGTITKVSVGEESIRVEGNAPGGGEGWFLAEIPMEFLLDDPARLESLVDVERAADGNFTAEVPRYRDRKGRNYDRLTSRWQLVRRVGAEMTAQSSARYADDIACRAPDLPEIKPSSKKGLGGWSADRTRFAGEELKELGITAVTVNMMIHSLVALEPGANTTPFEWQGRIYHMRNEVLAQHDRTFREAATHGAMVSAILLVANPARGGDALVKLLGHPDAVKEGTFAMPNVTSEEGIALYGAILNLMAERWSRPDGKYGRVHHWIMHNEVDAGWVWTNAGEKPAVVYMDLYHRSMRLMDLIARQYDPHARPFITLTHHWAEAGEARWYGSKVMLEELARFGRAEGDFPWALAHHPYPQNLFNPRAWEDNQATFDFNTPKVTPKNLEVLEAYMRQAEMLHQGEVRPIHLSENGFNSMDYSEKELADQAAGMAMAWKKIMNMPAVESWQYHNWIDNRAEGGLKIGLRKFPDEPGDPYGKKPIWHVFKAIGTAAEDEVCEPYLKVIGISSWEDIIHTGAIGNQGK